MGYGNGETVTAVELPVGASEDALLLATVWAVGLPVEVQIRDGSLYSGVFHTASIDDGYAIVLKKARMIEKGMSYSNIEVGALLDTLVVLSNDLVQVIVKDFLLPMEGDIDYSIGDGSQERIEAVDSQGTDATFGNVDNNQENKTINCSVDADIHDTLHVKKLPKSLDNNHNDLGGTDGCLCREEVEEQSHRHVVSVPEGQVGESEVHADTNSRSHIEMNSCTNTVVCEAHHSNSCFCPPQEKFISQNHDVLASKKALSGYKRGSSPVYLSTRQEGCKGTSDVSAEAPSSNAQMPTISTSSSSVSSDNNPTCSNISTSPNLPASEGNPFCNTYTKGFKLNPEAKVFFPSFASARSTSAVIPTIVNTSYVTSISPAMSGSAAQSSLEISSFPSCTPLPAKFVQYNPLVSGQTGINTQYPQHISGQVHTRQQPARFVGQYHPTIQTGTAYMHQNTQPVMVGRTGQLFYVHPICQDPMQGTAVLSQGFPVLTHCQANMPKLQGTPAQSLQFCMAPPLVTAAQVQPFAMPAPIPFSSTLPAFRPITVPGGNAFYGSKFH